MKTTYFFNLLISVLIYSCSSPVNTEITIDSKNYEELGKACFLLGEWQNVSSEGVLTEMWEKQNDSSYSGRSFFIAGKDTSFSERILLQQKGKQLFYIPAVKNQNNGQPVEFLLSEASPTYASFVNPQHDFPSKITYTLVTKDSLVAEISGNVNGKLNTQQFQYKRF